MLKLNKGDTYYYARILPNLGVYDVLDIKIRTVGEDWFVGLETRDKQAFIFNNKDIDRIVFDTRIDAVMRAKEAEEGKLPMTFTIDNSDD